MSVPGSWYLALAAVLFSIGAVGLLVRRNMMVMMMCIELMLNAVNLTFVTFARMLDDIGGQVVVVFVLVVEHDERAAPQMGTDAPHAFVADGCVELLGGQHRGGGTADRRFSQRGVGPNRRG